MGFRRGWKFFGFLCKITSTPEQTIPKSKNSTTLTHALSPPTSRSIHGPGAIAAGLALDPKSDRHRRRPRARPRRQVVVPEVAPPSRKLHPTSTHPRTLPPLPEIEPRSSHSTIRRPSSCPPDIQSPSSRISIPATSGAPSSCSRCCRICCYRGSIAGLPLLPDMLMPGIHLQAHYAATGPAAGAPSPSSCAPPESSRPRALR